MKKYLLYIILLCEDIFVMFPSVSALFTTDFSNINILSVGIIFLCMISVISIIILIILEKQNKTEETLYVVSMTVMFISMGIITYLFLIMIFFYTVVYIAQLQGTPFQN